MNTRKDHEELKIDSTPTQTSEKSGMTRRDFLVTGTGAMVALSIGGCGPEGNGSLPKPKPPKYLLFKEPRMYTAGRDKKIGRDLHVKLVNVAIKEAGKPDRMEQARTYNGSVPGPTFRLLPGERLEFKVINELPKNTVPPGPVPNPEDWAPYLNDDCAALSAKNIPNCFNTTNLHTHGLHVSPITTGDDPKTGTSSDDVHIRIPPAGDTLDDGSWPSTRPYCIQLPDFHAPGTHWYHSHIHGSTGIQVSNGLAGALIVDEPDNQKIPVDKDLIWIIQEIIGNQDTRVYANIRDANGKQLFGSGQPSASFTVNSLASSTIEMEVGQIHRWRFINATSTPRGFMNIALQDSNGSFVAGAMYLIAVDGITFYGKAPQPLTSPEFMAPANRADFLVQFKQAGTYTLWKKKAVVRPGGGTGPTQDQALVTIEVTDTGKPPQPLPALPALDNAPCYLQPIQDSEVQNTPKRTYEFNVQSGRFGQYTINGVPYGNPEHMPPNTDVPLGNAEEWTLTNVSGAAHPFHIHVNPFQVVEIYDPNVMSEPRKFTPEEAVWWDTFTIPPMQEGKEGYVKIRSRFLTYYGKFVFHCHILVHEDVGMMQDITVTRASGQGYGPCVKVQTCTLQP